MPLGPVYEPSELLDDEQYLARRFLTCVSQPGTGSFCTPTLPMTLNGERGSTAPPKTMTVADIRGDTL